MIDINGVKYQALRMPPREQLHVLRRVTPLLAAIGPQIFELLNEGEQVDKARIMTMTMAVVGPMTELLAEMKDEQLDYVVNSCLLYVKRLDIDQQWHPIFVVQGRGQPILMYQDIDLLAQLRLVSEVLKVNLSGFFGALSEEGGSSNSAVS